MWFDAFILIQVSLENSCHVVRCCCHFLNVCYHSSVFVKN